MTLMEQLSAYIPYNEQEARDRALLLECLRREPDVMTRQNPLAHFTASAWMRSPWTGMKSAGPMYRPTCT